MKPVFIILPFLLISLLIQKKPIMPSKAGKFVGKIVSIEGYVLNIKSNFKSHTLSLGLSDQSNTKEVLTLIVHKKNFSKNYKRFYKNLKNQTIEFTGRVKKSDGRNVVFTEADTLKINFEIDVVEY